MLIYTHKLLEWWLFYVALKSKVTKGLPWGLLVALYFHLTALWHLGFVSDWARGNHWYTIKTLYPSAWILER